MKKIISLKDHILIATVVIVLGLFLHRIFTSYENKESIFIDFYLYFLVCLTYLYLGIKEYIRIRRISTYNLEEIKTYRTYIKISIVILLLLLHIYYISSMLMGGKTSIIYFIAGTTGFVRLVFTNQIYVSEEYILAGNELISIKEIKEVKDDGGSNLLLKVNEKNVSIFCGSKYSRDMTLIHLTKRESIQFSK